MAGFTIVDGAVAFVILISALLAYFRGFTREALAIIGWIAAAVVAFMFAAQAVPLVRQVPKVDDLLGGNCDLLTLAGFALVFAIALLLFSIFTPLFSSLIQRSVLGGLDQALGFLFGVARGILLVAVVFFLYRNVAQLQDVPIVDDSRAAAVFGTVADRIAAENPSGLLAWLTGQYEALVSTCPVPGGA